MNRQIYILLCIYLISWPINANKVGENEWNQVFATEGDSIGATKTLELLNRLEDIYDSCPEDKTCNTRNVLVGSLLRASQVSYYKCARNSFKYIDNLLESQQVFGVNLMPYLLHFRDELFVYCRDIFTNELQSSVSQSNIQQIKDMELLRVSILEEAGTGMRKFYHSIPQLAVRDGVLSFMELRSSLFYPDIKKGNREIFKQEFNRLVVNLCEFIRSDVSPSINIGDMVDYDNDLAFQLDTNSLDWLTNFKICEQVTSDPDSLCPMNEDDLSKGLNHLEENKKTRVTLFDRMKKSWENLTAKPAIVTVKN